LGGDPKRAKLGRAIFKPITNFRGIDQAHPAGRRYA